MRIRGAIRCSIVSPSMVHLRNARLDLVSVYDALKEPDKEHKFQAELAATRPSR